MSEAQKEKIYSYLQSPKSFEEGLHLYLKWGKKEVLKKIFQISGPTAYNHSKLILALKEELGSFTPKKEDKENKTQKRRRSPYVVDPKHPALIKLYRERALLKNQITLIESQNERKKAAFQILDITDKIEKILFFGFEKDKKKALPKDRAELYKKYYNNLKYCHRYKDRGDKAAELERRQLENKEIKKILNM